MNRVNVEIKARTADPGSIRALLQDRGAKYMGRDRQCDTYYRVPNGRLKLREGEIENALIYYKRDDTTGPKRSDVMLYNVHPGADLKDILSEALGVDVVVEKHREIYFIDNVKFHIDEIDGLGTYIEIEATDADGALGVEHLRTQCREYLDLFNVQPRDLAAESYSDMLR